LADPATGHSTETIQPSSAKSSAIVNPTARYAACFVIDAAPLPVKRHPFDVR
jgi:hypothetical protein